MKVKTSDLTGMALCYAVCMIEMPHLVWGETIGVHHASNQIVVPELKEPDCYSPFTDWSAAGPLIEREEITMQHIGGAAKWMSYWNDKRLNFLPVMYGPTPLIAAMRCYVASKLGDEVDVPEELV